MQPTDRRSFLASVGAGACASLAMPNLASAQPPPKVERAPLLKTAITEEGQTVIYDRYTWQRRELTKRLPLSEAWPSEFAIGPAFQKYGLASPPYPPAITTPSRIMSDVYLVNSDPNLCYLIDCGAEGFALVDPGLLKNVDSILKNIATLGFSPRALRWVINTHAHFDHAEADASFQRLGAKILIGRADAPAIEKETLVTARHVLPSAGPRASVAVKADHPVDEGEQLVLGDKTFTAISTPGHTPGSTCYLLTIEGRNILFGGDTVLYDYRLGFQGTVFADDVAYLASFKKLERFWLTLGKPLRFDILLPGHGTMVMDRAYMDVAKGLRQVQWCVTNGEGIKALPFEDGYYRKLMFGRP